MRKVKQILTRCKHLRRKTLEKNFRFLGHIQLRYFFFLIHYKTSSEMKLPSPLFRNQFGEKIVVSLYKQFIFKEKFYQSVNFPWCIISARGAFHEKGK